MKKYKTATYIIESISIIDPLMSPWSSHEKSRNKEKQVIFLCKSDKSLESKINDKNKEN